MPGTASSLPISAAERSIQPQLKLAVGGRERGLKPEDPEMEANRGKMVVLLSELAQAEGFHATILDGVKLRRSNRSEPRTPVLYEPSVYFVASGRKRGYVGDRCIVYGDPPFDPTPRA